MLNSKEYRGRLEGALKELSKNKEYINSLNVFPVPDGDTGLNMLATLERAAAEVRKCSGDSPVSDLAEAAAYGSLMGARGNSGVILSQLLRGFADGCKGKDQLDIKDFTAAIDGAVKKAYKAVNKPVEGTMLTVAREVASKAKSISGKTDEDTFFKEILMAAEDASAKTPTKLKVLRDAGVVDSGGEGLALILKGMLNNAEAVTDTETKDTVLDTGVYNPDIKYTYCTELIINSSEDKVPYLKGRLNRLGDSMIIAGIGNIIKLHIHTNEPGRVIDIAKALGELYDIKIDNMKRQHRETLFHEMVPYGFVVVAEGDGFTDMYGNIDHVAIVKGGITSNPSVEEIKSAAEGLNARSVYIFPGNKNIVMTARKVEDLLGTPVHILPTTSISEAAVAISVFDPEGDSGGNMSKMQEALAQAAIGSVASASKDATIDGYKIKTGDYLAVKGKDVFGSADMKEKALLLLLSGMISGNESFVTVYTSSKEMDENVQKEIKEKYPEVEFAFEYGGQPLYDYIVCKED